MTSRIIQKTSSRARNEARELLEFIFVTELIVPSRCLWIVSPWLRNIPVLDNSAGSYTAIAPDFPQTVIRLSRVLTELAARGTELIIVNRPGKHGGGIGDEVRANAPNGSITVILRDDLHTKGIVGDRFALTGSMNFTRNGIDHLDELIRFDIEANKYEAIRLEFQQQYGGGMPHGS